MNDLRKDAVNWLAVGDDAQGQRVDNYLVKILKGVPKVTFTESSAAGRCG
jgi:23S rRNA pseudouridine955/2504/2580 synthase